MARDVTAEMRSGPSDGLGSWGSVAEEVVYTFNRGWLVIPFVSMESYNYYLQNSFQRDHKKKQYAIWLC